MDEAGFATLQQAFRQGGSAQVFRELAERYLAEKNYPGLFEARLGFGADIRINPKLSLSPMLTFGVGLFGRAELVDEDGTAVNLIEPNNDQDGHGWFTLQLGAHFDLRGGR